jgi:hypothetical protein
MGSRARPVLLLAVVPEAIHSSWVWTSGTTTVVLPSGAVFQTSFRSE